MRKFIYAFVLMLLAFTSCSKDESIDIADINKQTMIVFMPWSGTETDRGLYNIFLENIDSIEGAIKKNKGIDGRLVVFISRTASESELYEITYANGKITHAPIKTYAGNSYTTANGITKILDDVKDNAYALNYGLIIGCHGCGWTFKNDWNNYPNNAKRNILSPINPMMAKPSAYATYPKENFPRTRFFGSVSDVKYGIDINTLAQAIHDAQMTMQFILFDDCYMANIETAYELRGVTNFLIASTSEVLAIGMPYQSIWNALATTTPAYEKVVLAFHDFYSNYLYPYGALSVIDCRQVERMADIMKTINSNYKFEESQIQNLQVLDGFDIPIFFDMGDYVDHVCQNKNILSDFHSQLNKLVRAKTNTEKLYSYLIRPKFIDVKTYSGITVSDPSKNPVSLKGLKNTGWWKATH